MSFKCPTCDRAFKNVGGWQSHATAKGHAFSWQFICEICNRPWKDAEALQKHHNKHPGATQSESNLAVEVQPRSSNTTATTTQLGRCTECPDDFEPRAVIEEHFAASDLHPNCTRCNVGTLNADVLKVHMEVAHSLMHCEVCNMEIYREEKQQHDATHSKPILFSCAQCGQGYPTNIALREHYSDSAAEHPMCALCEVGFADDAECDQHMSASHPPKSAVRSLATTLHKETPAFSPSGVGCTLTDASSPEVLSEARHAVAIAPRTDVEQHGSDAALPSFAPHIPAAASIGIKSILIEGIHHRTLEEINASKPTSRSPDLISLLSASVEPLAESPTDPSDRALESKSPTLLATPASAPVLPVSLIHDPAIEDHVLGSTAALGSRTSPEFTVPKAEALSADAAVAALSNSEAKADVKAPDTLPKSESQAATSRHPSIAYDLLTGRTLEAEGVQSTHPNTDGPANGNVTKLTAMSHVVARPPATVSLWHCRVCFKDPCEDPTATICGHIFCHECIVIELATNHQCPVCKSTMLVRLKVEN